MLAGSRVSPRCRSRGSNAPPLPDRGLDSSARPRFPGGTRQAAAALSRLTTGHIQASRSNVSIRLGREPVALPEPLNALIRKSHPGRGVIFGLAPAREMVAAWLKAGVIDQGRFAPTERGSPQGGVITPPKQCVGVALVAAAAGGPFPDGDTGLLPQTRPPSYR
jgi:hypothetical protein